jgi:hypothetical protein
MRLSTEKSTQVGSERVQEAAKAVVGKPATPLIVPGGIHLQNFIHSWIVFQDIEIPGANARDDPTSREPPLERLKKRGDDEKIANVVIAKDENRVR